MKLHPQNILVMKLCCLGDLIFLTPTLRALHNAFPESRITMLISKWVEPIVQCMPYVDDYIVFDAPYSGTPSQKVTSTLTLIGELRKRRFDLILLGHRNRFFAILSALTGAKTRAGFGNQLLLTHSAEFDPTIHEVDRYLSIIDKLGIERSGTETELLPNKNDREYVTELLAERKARTDRMLIGVFPGGGENPGTSMVIKRWYPQYYAELINRLIAQFDCEVVLIGSKTEWELAEFIRGSVKNAGNVFNLAGKPNLRQLIALEARCSLFIGGDSGPTHIAAAVGTPSVMLFGPSDPRLVAPRGAHHRYAWKQPTCSPCYTPVSALDKKNMKGKEFVCWTGTHECMKNMSIEHVFSLVSELLPMR